MARKARVKDDFGIFYIHQLGGRCRGLFQTDEDRTVFLNILKQAQSKFQFKLYAFCLLSENEYHLVLDVNGGDLSKIMKSINIRYAMYVKCEGPIFKDRYKSELLKDNIELIQKIQSIHGQGNASTAYNSFCVYNTDAPIKLDFVTPLYQDQNDICQDSMTLLDECENCIRSLSEAKQKLLDIALSNQMSEEQLIKDKDCRNKLISDFRKESTLSLKELGVLFGGLSESTICKILNKTDENA